jgi:hypothetical protein
VNTTQSANDKVFQIIDNILLGTVGAEATRLIYVNLERRYSLKQCEISNNIDVFTEGLEDFLNGAALPIENKILNDILVACNFESGVTLQMAVPEEYDSASQGRVAT